MEIKRIGVIGAGSMGNGIAQVAAEAGYQVIMRDIEDRFVQNGLKAIEKFLSKSVEKGKMAEEQKKEILGRIRGTTRMEDLKEVDFVIEAIFEDLSLKKDVFKQLDELTRPHVILTTNTSSMSVTEIAMATKRPEKVAGMHFFNPAPLMKLVEVIRAYHTNDETVRTVMEMARKWERNPWRSRRIPPGLSSTVS